MFLLIGGIQPRTVDLDTIPQACLSCGYPSLRLRRTDQYLSLFFIPLLRIKKGSRFLDCAGCRAVYSVEGIPSGRDGIPTTPESCRRCGRAVNPDFNLCPYCGRRLHTTLSRRP
jgi:ribosomal protein L37E